MAGKHRKKIHEPEITGVKYFRKALAALRAAALSTAASLLKRKTGSGMVKWRLHRTSRSIARSRSALMSPDGPASGPAASRRRGARCRFWEMVCFSICGLASEEELLAHKREVATATSRFMNAAQSM